MSLRTEKVAQAIKKEVSLIIHNELNDPRVGFVTITNVEITADLRTAKVFYSVLGPDIDCQRTKEALDSAVGYIRRLMGDRIKLRFTPELIFRPDHASEYSVKIQKLLEEVKDDDEHKESN